DDALQQVVWRAGAGVARHIVWIVDGAHHVLLEPRRHLIGRDHGADLVAPWPVDERLGRRADHRAGAAGAHGASEHDAASEKRAAVEQAVAGDRLQRVVVTLGYAHAGLPGVGVLSRP